MVPAKPTVVEPGPEPAELAHACGVLNRAGVRIMRLDGFKFGVWSDLAGPEIRAALHALGMDELAVQFLDGSGIPLPYKIRRVPERETGMSWIEWTAGALNQLFQQQGRTGEPGRIMGATICHAERTAGKC